MAQSTTPFQSLYRMMVMAGTLGVGSMAAYLYGPPPEKLANLIDQGMQRMTEIRGGETAPVVDAEPPKLATTTGAAAPRFSDSQIQTASAFSLPVAGTKSEGAALLIEAGATEATVKPWGIQGKVYRATASMPAGATGMTRQFDAIAESAEQATQDVLAQVQASFRATR